jgi:hypothetical protein
MAIYEMSDTAMCSQFSKFCKALSIIGIAFVDGDGIPLYFNPNSKNRWRYYTAMSMVFTFLVLSIVILNKKFRYSVLKSKIYLISLI